MLSSIGGTHDGSDELIISSKLAESYVCRKIGKLTPIDPVSLQVAVKIRKDAEKFSFPRSSTVPRTVLHMAADPFAMITVIVLVSNGNLSMEDLLTGLPVL